MRPPTPCPPGSSTRRPWATATLLVLALVPPSRAAAQADPAATDPPALALTLAQAVERAVASSPGLALSRALGRAAEADVSAARAGRMPQLELSAGYTLNSDVPELTLAQAGAPPRTIFPNIPDNYRGRIQASVPIYTGGRTGALLRAAQSESLAAGREVEATTADVVLQTTTAYWSLVTSLETERVLSEALTAYDAHLRDARNRQEAGLAATNEVLAVQVERDRAELSRLQAASARDLAQANLAVLLALPPGGRVEPVERLQGTAVEKPDPDRLVETALAGRAERQALLSRVAAAEARVGAERAARFPQLAAAAGYDYANPNRKILPPEARWNDTWDVSVSLSVSLFDGGRASAAVARAEARADAARRQLEELERRIRLQVTRASLDLGTATAAVGVAEQGLAAAQENNRVAADRYREGLIPSSELLDSEVALLRAGLDRAEALAQVRLAAAELQRAVGR